MEISVRLNLHIPSQFIDGTSTAANVTGAGSTTPRRAAIRARRTGSTNPDRPRILLFDHTAALGGGEIALLNLVRELRSCHYDVQVLLGAPGPLVIKLAEIGLVPHILPMDSAVTNTRKDSLGAGSFLRVGRLFSVVRYAYKLSRFLRQQKIRILHTNSLKSDVIGALAGRWAGVPVIWHVRDRICPEYLPRNVVRAFRLAARFLPTCLIANSAATMQTLPRRTSSHIVHDGVEKIPPLPVQAPLTGAQSLIGMVGRISPWKGQHVFLQAAAQVLEKFPQVRFQIVGAPLFNEHDYDRELHTLVRTLKLESHVEFTGFRDDVQELIPRMDIVIHASTIGEPFGQVVIEAMGAGRPIVATNGGGVPEIVQDGQTGLLVPMNDVPALARAMLHLLACPQLARDMGLNGRARVEAQFMVAHAAEKIETIYAALLRR